jgi:hypothetical protein
MVSGGLWGDAVKHVAAYRGQGNRCRVTLGPNIEAPYAKIGNSEIISRVIRLMFDQNSPNTCSRSRLYETCAQHLRRYSLIRPGNVHREALESIRLQNDPEVEHLIIGGLSTDHIVELLRSLEFSDEDQRVKWLSEKDGGQSEARNKGFDRAKGEIVGWLNAGDCYRPGRFERIVQAFTDYPEVDVFSGDYALVDERGKALQIRREIEFNLFVLRYRNVLYIATTAVSFGAGYLTKEIDSTRNCTTQCTLTSSSGWRRRASASSISRQFSRLQASAQQ